MKSKSQLYLSVFLLVVTAILSLQGCVFANSLMYAATALEAWVKDAQTDQPLDGVIVVAHWKLREGFHPDTVGELMVMETVTDATGRMYFSAWGPRVAALGTYLSTSAPNLVFFKPGYQPAYLSNKITKRINRSLLRHSEWHGKTIKLKKSSGSLEEYAERLGTLDQNMDFAFDYNDCSWKQIPRMLVAIDREVKPLREKKIFANFNTIEDRESKRNSSNCGSIREFLRSYIP